MGKDIIYGGPVICFDMDGTLNKWRWTSLETVRANGYFRTVEPHPSVIEAMKILNESFLVSTLSSAWVDDGHSVEDKEWWLDKHCSFLSKGRRFFSPCGENKADYFFEFFGRPLTRADILVDDCTDVLNAWVASGGTGIKVRTPENGSHGRWQSYSFDVDADPRGIALYIAYVQGTQLGVLKQEMAVM